MITWLQTLKERCRHGQTRGESQGFFSTLEGG
jgi:hypothetical protein